MNGFENAKLETLIVIEQNLLNGLREVASTIEAGTFHTVGPKGEAPPSQSGHLTLALLKQIRLEIKRRRTMQPPMVAGEKS